MHKGGNLARKLITKDQHMDTYGGFLKIGDPQITMGFSTKIV